MKQPPKSSAGGRGMKKAKYRLGQVVRHRYHAFRGIIFDVDPVFNST